MKNYDKRVKQTRILLSDYLLLKEFSQGAGVSMAEALHSIIAGEWAMANKAKPVAVATKPAFRVEVPVTQPAFRVKVPVSITTNGGKMPAIRIKTKGVKQWT